MTKRITWIALMAIALYFGSHSAGATILIFDQRAPNMPTSDSAPVPQAYGDNVTMSPQGGFTYGNNTEGFTPNVVVDYGPGTSRDFLWTTQYGDLVNVLFRGSGGILEVTLTADPGVTVRLHDFDMAGWPNADYWRADLAAAPPGREPDQTAADQQQGPWLGC